MSQPQNPPYRLVVAAGPDYDKTTHQIVEVNGETTSLSSEKGAVQVAVHIKDYNGLPKSCPESHPYFDHELHKSDTLSISLAFKLNTKVNGNDLVFGNDFDHSIKSRLPMGFSIAMNIVKTVIDPSIDGDAYAEKPYLYSPGLATWSQFRIGSKDDSIPAPDTVIEEGASDPAAQRVRDESKMPATSSERKKHFQSQQHREAFDFEAGRYYMADFSTGYINLSDLSLNLPGFRLPVHGLIDYGNHELRYVLKNRKTNEVYFVVVLVVMPFNESIPPEAQRGKNPYGFAEEEWKARA
ncbi:hypothetical protein N7468_005256 [Penicillium chermesinum]|uniref:Domain of unknown function at the cortex 1 domain-containing protein n=1 Tax=Penicillium chermesinum TaxID=63820 RepID=A0A9W9TMU1_9EURO|nr:uncharacterized protein N7468_005256 [Penicillium chermesinum]KAJ5232300.1 hypothetical protein N7468_005256 [Penicillium chermesinum]KAJ6171956.1 hypothetical protein N7470_001023 [Penicillium chermesinum]